MKLQQIVMPTAGPIRNITRNQRVFMSVGSDSTSPSFGRHTVYQAPYTDTADRHRLLVEVWK